MPVTLDCAVNNVGPKFDGKAGKRNGRKIDMIQCSVCAAFASVIDAAKAKASTVTVSSVCPRLKTADITNKIDAVNAGLVTLCADKKVIFADSTPSFMLGDGSVNDGYLHRDGIHLTHAAVNRLAKGLRLKKRNDASGVCSGERKPQYQHPHPPTALNHGGDAEWTSRTTGRVGATSIRLHARVVPLLR